MRIAASCLVLVLVLGSGCGSTSTADPAPPAADAGADAPAVSPCDAVAPAALAIDAAGPDSQIHVIGAYSAGRLFVAYNRPKAGAQTFDVFLTAFGCDGTPVFPPVRVNDDADNDVDPSLAIAGDTVLVSWAGDATGQDPNLHLQTRAFDRQGAPLGPPRTFTGPRRALQQTKFNIWQGSLSPLGTGFALAGAWGVDDAPAFQAFGARLDAQGAPTGDAFDLGFDAGTTQTSIDVASSGTNAWAAWLVEPNMTDGMAVATARFGIAGATTPGPRIENAGSPIVATLDTTAWVVAQRGTKDVVLQRLDTAGAPVVHVGKGAQPALALSASGGAFASYRDAGAGRTIVLTSFDSAGAILAEKDLGVTDAAPYPLRLVRIADDVYFLAYSLGKSPALRAMGRFFDLRAK